MDDFNKKINQSTSSSFAMFLKDPSLKALGFIMATFGIFASDAFMGGNLIYSRIKKFPLPLIMFGIMISRKIWYQTVRTLAQGGQLTEDMIQNTNFKNKVIVITGGTSGIGKSTAIQILKWGAQIILGFRDEAKAIATKQEMMERAGVTEDFIHLAPLSLDDLSSVKSFADTVLAKFPKIDMLINNAGIMTPEIGSFSKDNVDIQFATNHLGHFFLTKLFLNSIKKQNGKIINISSGAHAFIPDNKTPNMETYIKPSLEKYDPIAQYAFSKICNIWFTRKLQQKLWEDPNTTATAYAVHPGIVKTELSRSSNYIIRAIYAVFGPVIFKDCDSGAATQLMVAASPKENLVPGHFYAECKAFSVIPLATSGTYAEELWKFSENLIEKYNSKSHQ